MIMICVNWVIGTELLELSYWNYVVMQAVPYPDSLLWKYDIEFAMDEFLKGSSYIANNEFFIS